MMRYGIPVPAPRAVLDAEVARIAALGSLGRARLSRAAPRATTATASTRSSSRSARTRQACVRSCRRSVADPRRRAVCTSPRRRAPDARPARRRLRRRQHRDGRRPHGPAARRRRTRHRLPAHPRRMPAHDVEVAEALEEGVTVRWLSTITAADGARVVVEKMRSTTPASRSRPGSSRSSRPTRSSSPLGQGADLSLLHGGTASGRRRRRAGRTGLMTGHPGIFAGGDMVPAERTVTTPSATAAGGAGTSTRGCAASRRPRRRPPTGARSNGSTPGTTAMPRTPCGRSSTPPARVDFRRGGRRSGRATALFEARRCLSCGNCFECDNCYGMCPDNAVIKLGPGLRLPIDYDYCKGCGICVAECPCGAIEMVPEPEGEE